MTRARTAWTLLALVAVVAAIAPTAWAHQPRALQSRSQLVSLQAHHLKRLKHATQVLRFFERHPELLNSKRSRQKAWRIVHQHQREVRRAAARLIAVRAKLKALARPPHYEQWLCIHRGEGAWNANTGNGYHGGLQMDREFMLTYGRRLYVQKGGAENWTPLEQMWVAERAWRTRGFWPWPNTARACGLL